MKKIFKVNEDFVNTRLDRWIKKNVFQVPQSFIEKNIRKGKIKVNSEKKKSSYKLKIDDQVFFYNVNISNKINTSKLDKYLPTKKDLAFSSNIFIEDNENFCVINKPSGISVQSGTKSKRNIIDILSKTREFENFTPFSVHRIDKDTSGILIVAKNRKYAQLFTSLFRLRKIHKIYLAIVIGELNNKKGTLNDMLYHYEGNKKIKSKAITHFDVIDIKSGYSLIKLNPETGKKHQLRKQLLFHGHPIFGDSKYSYSKNFTKNQLMLHAYKINFMIADIKYNFSADLPLEFKQFLKKKNLKTF